MLKYGLTHETKTLTSSTSATIQIPAMDIIHNLILRFATSADADVTEAAIRSEIGNIRLTIDGEDLINATAIKLLDMYEALGRAVNDNTGVASVLELNIGALIFTDPAVREIFGLGMANVTSVQVTVTAGTLSTIANVTAYTNRTRGNANLGVYAKCINYPVSFNATGDHTMDTLPRDPNSSYLILLNDAGASGTQTFGEVKVNNENVLEKRPIAANRQTVSNMRLSSPTGYYVYAFCDGDMRSRLPMVGVRDFRVKNTFSVAPGAGGYNITALSVNNLEAALKAVA